MASNFLQDWLINKLNGYFLIIYASGHPKMAWIAEQINEALVFSLVLFHLIPPRLKCMK